MRQVWRAEVRVFEKGLEVIYAMSWLAGTVIMKEALFDQVGNLIQLAKYCPFPFTRNNILVHGRSLFQAFEAA